MMIRLLKHSIRHLSLFLVAIGIFLPVAGSAAAEGAISQGFTTSDDAVVGSLMQLKTDSRNVAELATSTHPDNLIGVVGKNSLVELSSDSHEIEVVTSGMTPALVSNINGDINIGDKITASPISGVGMKATESTTIVGVAQAKLDSSNASKQTITDKSGHERQVLVGSIPVQVNVTYFAPPQDKLSVIIPSFLQTISNYVAGKNVPPVRVLVSTAALILGFATVAIMLYSAIRSGLIAIGRNPMAQGALRKGLLEIGLTGLGIILLTVMIIYIVLAI